MEEPVTNSQRHIEITVDDLPLHCPMPSMILWNAHPRVYMPIQKTGEALCPYCGQGPFLSAGRWTRVTDVPANAECGMMNAE